MYNTILCNVFYSISWNGSCVNFFFFLIQLFVMVSCYLKLKIALSEYKFSTFRKRFYENKICSCCIKKKIPQANLIIM